MNIKISLSNHFIEINSLHYTIDEMEFQDNRDMLKYLISNIDSSSYFKIENKEKTKVLYIFTSQIYSIQQSF